jgi:crotonobetainyl-CoA:carnitine CoA-transferase CaiB-like acyl-CoA transferase
MTTPQPLDGTVVLEYGRRLACGAAGALLAQLGAIVFFVEGGATSSDTGFEDKYSQRDLFAYGKQSLRWDGKDDDAALRQLIAVADVVITSSDADAAHCLRCHRRTSSYATSPPSDRRRRIAIARRYRISSSRP